MRVRAKRRFDELSKNNNENLKFEDVINNIHERDNEDTKRTNSPLKKAKDSIVINTNNLNLDELEKIYCDIDNDFLKSKVPEIILFYPLEPIVVAAALPRPQPMS